MCGHSSRRQVTLPLKQPTRATSRNRPICRPYSVLLPVGFTVPVLLPVPRCALAAPFRPYPAPSYPGPGRYPFCGTIPEPCQSKTRRALPGTVVPWSPDFPRPRLRGAAAARPSGEADIDERHTVYEGGVMPAGQAIVSLRPSNDDVMAHARQPISGAHSYERWQLANCRRCAGLSGRSRSGPLGSGRSARRDGRRQDQCVYNRSDQPCT